MAALGQLVVNLSANVTSFTSAMSKAAYTADSTMQGIAKSAKIAGAVLGTALVAGAGALANEMRKMIDAADALGKTAQKVGVSAEKLSVFQYAAELSGLSAESLSASLVKLNKAAADGNKGFDAMGISVKNADGTLKSTDSLLVEVADKFSKYKDSAEKTALAVQIFGKAGAEMLPFLNLGAEGLKKMQTEAEKLGIVIGGGTTQAAEAFNDNLTRLSMVKKGIVNQITTAMLPSLVSLTDALFNSAANTDVFRKVGDILAATLKVVATILISVYGATEMVIKGFISLGKAAYEVARGNFRAAVNEINKGGQDMANSIRDAVKSVATIWQEAEAAAKDAAGTGKNGLSAPLVKGAEDAAKAAEKIKGVLDGLVDEYNKLKYTKEELVTQELRALGASEAQIQQAIRQMEATKGLVEQKEREAAVVQRVAEKNQVAADLYKEWETLLESTLTTTEKITKEQEKLLDLRNRLIAAGYEEAEVNRRIGIAMGNVADKYSDVKKMSVEFGKTISSAFEDALIKGKNLREIIQGLEKDIIALITRMLITKPLGNAIEGVVGSFLSASGFGGATQSPAPITTATATDFGGFFADGGTLGAGKWGIAGEAGPEIIHGPAQITPMTTGNTVSVNNVFYLQTPTDRRTQQQIASQAGMSVQRAMARNT
jgi:hypothetical protein